MSQPRIEPCRNPEQLRAYIDEHWRRGHVLATDETMFRFTYMTPWVNRDVFPEGVSVLTVMNGDGPSSRMLGFLGAICAPYPRPTSYWLALWHVLPELKGTGLGGKLLQTMQEIALTAGGKQPYGRAGWIGTFGAGPEALPVYLKRGYAVRSGRRWIYQQSDGPAQLRAPMPEPIPMNLAECAPAEAWLAHRFDNHPIYKYERKDQCAFRTEVNDWGRVTHAVRVAGDWREHVHAVYEREKLLADIASLPYIMDAWAFDCPGPGWELAPNDLPSVFHPPEARGNVTNAVGLPFIPSAIHKGDCDQDRPNATDASQAHESHGSHGSTSTAR